MIIKNAEGRRRGISEREGESERESAKPPEDMESVLECMNERIRMRQGDGGEL